MRRPSLRKLYSAALSRSGAPALVRRAQRQRLAIVTYHDIAPGVLERHLDFLVRAYHPITLSQGVAALRSGDTLPENPLAVTFDDGYRSFHHSVFPVLQRFGVPATVFLTTGYAGEQDILWFNWIDIALESERSFDTAILPLGSLDISGWRLRASLMAHLKAAPDDERLRLVERIKRTTSPGAEQIERYRLMTWEQARELERSGLVSIGGHTRTHPILARCSPDKQRQEIAGCAADLERELGPAERHFAYPNGEQADFTLETKEIVRSTGFASAASARRGLCAPGEDLYALRRVALDGSFSVAEVQAKLSGLWMHTGRGGK